MFFHMGYRCWVHITHFCRFKLRYPNRTPHCRGAKTIAGAGGFMSPASTQFLLEYGGTTHWMWHCDCDMSAFWITLVVRGHEQLLRKKLMLIKIPVRLTFCLHLSTDLGCGILTSVPVVYSSKSRTSGINTDWSLHAFLWVTLFHPKCGPKDHTLMIVQIGTSGLHGFMGFGSINPSCVVKYQILFVEFPEIIAIVCELLILLVGETQIVGSIPFALGTTMFVGHIIKTQCLLANHTPLSVSNCNRSAVFFFHSRLFMAESGTQNGTRWGPKLDGCIDQTCSTTGMIT